MHRPALSSGKSGVRSQRLNFAASELLDQRHFDDDNDKMARGVKKHQKRLSAPKHWLLDKLSGAYAPKASPGPHKLRDCMPLIVFIRNRYAMPWTPTGGAQQEQRKRDAQILTGLLSQSEVRPQWPRGQADRHAAPDQGRRQGPH